MRTPQLSALRSLLAAGLLFGTHCFAVDSSPVVVSNYNGVDGDSFALAVRSPLPATDSITRHVILVDTSASQVGEVRETTLKLVSEVIANLPANNLVQIFAVDVECEALTDGFVPATSRHVNDAVQKLIVRTPLGTTSLQAAFENVNSIADTKLPTSVLYIGDGLTSADRIQQNDLKTLVSNLTSNNVSVHSLVLGPQASLELPGILANLTGGTVARSVFGREANSATTVARAMLVAPLLIDHLQVDDRKLPIAGLPELLIRSDRHTIVFGNGSIGEFTRLSAVANNQILLEWNQTHCTTTEAGPEIRHLLNRVEASHGINASIASLKDLKLAKSEFDYVLKNTVAASEHQRRSGKYSEARRLDEAAKAMIAPAKVILTSASSQPPAFGDDAETLPPAPAGGLVGNDEFPGAPPQADNPLSAVEAEVKLQTQILTAETNALIEEAKVIGADSPDYATNLLKDALETIQASANISPDHRAELERRVVAALGTVSNQREVSALIRKQVAKEQAIAEAQRNYLADQDIEEERLAILIDQVRSLLNRAQHGDRNGFEDAEAGARTALELRPGNGPATQALVMSESSGQLDKAYRLVNLRHDRFLEVLYQVELSHVPFPDEPPIQYPPADVWRNLTLTRKPKYESFDLRNEKPVEKWLSNMLDKPVPLLDYQAETPLSEVLEQISNYYTTTWGQDGAASGTDFRMTIYEDKAELELESIDSLEDVTVSGILFEGMTLRNALKLIFAQTTDPELTYVIDNEVLKVTTVTKANETLTTRVYPVADLVIPPIQLGGGGGQGGGGLGGGGGGQGGFGGGGGGQGGFGGGGGGQGGFGGGGGQFSLPAEAINALNHVNSDGISSDAVNKLKKKPAVK